MAGICMTLSNNGSIDNITRELLINQVLEIKDTYKDDVVQISQVALKNNNFKMFEKDDLVIFVDGFTYSLDETNKIFNLHSQNFSEQLFDSYKKGLLSKVLNKTDGFFNATIYDKTNKKILIISDRLGTRFIYYYFKDNTFAFCSDVKGLLTIPQVDKTIDKTAISSLIDDVPSCHMYGDYTYFENIKLIKPSSIIEYDIQSNKMTQEYYWKFSEIKPSNTSYEESIDILHDLIEKAVLKRIKNIDLNKLCLPLSGGLDSRLLFAIMNNHKMMPPHIFTNGTPDCTDVVYAKRLCKKYKYKQAINQASHLENYLQHGESVPWIDEGMTSFIEHNSYSDIDLNNYIPFSISGYLGDVIFGNSFKANKKILDKRMDDTIAENFYGKYKDLANYNDDYYDIAHFEASLFMNRVRRFTAQLINFSQNISENILPYIDNDIIDFIYSIPDEYRFDNNLYADMLLKYYPEYFEKIPWNRNNRPIQGKIYKNNKSFVNIITNIVNENRFLSPKWKNSILKRCNIDNFKYKRTYHVFQEELSDPNNIEIIKEKYINDESLLKKYVDEQLYNTVNFGISQKNTTKIALYLTVEWYLRALKERNYI